MRTNSQVGSYAYANPTVARRAPSSVTPTSGGAQTLTYDGNGNMLIGLSGKVMTYDGENRPLSVSYAGKQTCYIYDADGARLKKLEGHTGAACATPGTGGITRRPEFSRCRTKRQHRLIARAYASDDIA